MTEWSGMVRLGLLALIALMSIAEPRSEYQRRVDAVRKTKGFAVLWDFVHRSPDGRFDAWKRSSDTADYRLDPVNYVRDYWSLGRSATYDDFPLLGSGPFGQAVRFKAETDPDFRPCLMVPRERLRDSSIDVKGPGRSVSMVVWLVRESGNHAIAGIWHEGTDLARPGAPVRRVERGMRQYALFAGLAANDGAAAVHVSENGGPSFGDKYARNLAVTPELIPTGWSVVAFSFDNARNTVTAYLNGVATEYWIDNLPEHPFFKWPYKGWSATDPALAYRPPASFTRVRNGELTGLRVNPFWFPHDLYTPPADSGGPFTIGRVIHSSRTVGFTGYIGAVAVFDRALSAKEMKRLAALARKPIEH